MTRSVVLISISLALSQMSGYTASARPWISRNCCITHRAGFYSASA